MNLAELIDMGIRASLDADGGLLLNAPQGALTHAVVERIRQSKPGLIAEIRGVREVREVGELHPSMFTPLGKGTPIARDVHHDALSRAWLLHFPDRDPMEVWTAPPATHDEILVLYPASLAAEPLALIEPGPPAATSCRSCRHRATPGRADPGYCAERTDQSRAYGDGHPLHQLPADGGTDCPKWAPHE